ncbi:MAG: S8 family serine peptidase [Clostridiales bacterium]|nr:S8 family serine peptidase [Clostridiales bacterium]
MKEKTKRILLSVLCVFFISLVLCLQCIASPEYDGFIVKFKDEKSKALAEEYVRKATLSDGNRKSADDDALVGISSKMNLSKTYDEELIKKLEELGLVEYSEPDVLLSLYGYDYSAEPYNSSQWSLSCSNVYSAWDNGVYGNDVIVAVVDSGIITNHPDLQDNILEGFSTVTGDNDVEDKNGHGTAVSGIIAAISNGAGVTGVAHRAKILPLKVTDAGTFGVSGIPALVEFAVSHGASVLNISFGVDYPEKSPNTLPTLKACIDYALDNNMIVVAAAGNNGGSYYAYPASYDGVISVANLKKVSSTSFAPADDSRANDLITIIAPGQNVITTYLKSYSYYSSKSGTSFASPFVAGIAALAKSVDKNITPAHFIELLKDTANKRYIDPWEDRNDMFGYGIADADALINALISEKTAGGYISPVDKKSDGQINITVKNTSADIKTFTVLVKSVNETTGRIEKTGVYTCMLAPGERTELNIADKFGFYDNVECFLLDSVLRPMYTPVYCK